MESWLALHASALNRTAAQRQIWERLIASLPVAPADTPSSGHIPERFHKPSYVPSHAGDVQSSRSGERPHVPTCGKWAPCTVAEKPCSSEAEELEAHKQGMAWGGWGGNSCKCALDFEQQGSRLICAPAWGGGEGGRAAQAVR
eukprot:1158094-Pelagomonas_calceolata.AAC.1